MTAEQVAQAHYTEQVAVAEQAAAAAEELWGQVDPAAIGGWAALVPTLLSVVSAAQVVAAAEAMTYLADLAGEFLLRPKVAGRVNPTAFAGASDGRSLDTLLYQPAIVALQAIRAGVDVEQALNVGKVDLDMIVRTQVADAGRTADGTALVAHREMTGYVRMLSPPSCSRCVILAGRRYEWNQGFLRHPRCDCRHIPAPEDTDDLRTDPQAYFRSLSEGEQGRVFGKAGAQAIRDGSDISRVVNARRGMYTAGGRKLTTEATTKRGIKRKVRLMPEQIYLEAQGDRREALRLLHLHGYLRA